MNSYIFRPNNVGRSFFPYMTESKYTGDGTGSLLRSVLGEENADRYLIAQDPVPGLGPGIGNVTIYISEVGMSAYHDIGTIERVCS